MINISISNEILTVCPEFAVSAIQCEIKNSLYNAKLCKK